MKPNLMSILFFALMLNSCTTSDLTELSRATAETAVKEKSILLVNNPYEATGEVFAEIYEGFLDTADMHDLDSILAASQSVAGFNELYQSGYKPLTSTQITAITSLGKTNFAELYSHLRMTPQGFGKLTSLANGFQNLKTASSDYESVISFVLNSESQLLAATDISETERRILLTTATIIRHRLDVEKRKRRKDRDWELSIGHIAATAYGAVYSDANAVISGLGSLYLE